MSGKPKTIPSASRNRHGTGESQQMPTWCDQNRAQKCVESGKAGLGAPFTANTNSVRSSDSPLDENFVNDDIIEENSHVIPPTRKPKSGNAGKHRKT